MTDFNKLQADVQAWLWRADAKTVANIPTLIQLAEARINRKLRISPMMVRATTNGDGTRFYPLPGAGSEPDYLDMRSLRLKGTANPSQDQLIQVTPEGLKIRESGTPSRYTVHREIELNTPLAAQYQLEMTYYTPFEALSATTLTNWLLTNSYDTYLYGTLQEAEPFLRNDERIPVWAQRWSLSINELEAADRRSRYNQSEIRQMPDPQESTP